MNLKVDLLDMYSLAGPVVRYGPIQRDSVTEVGVVAVLLPQVFSVALLSWRQRGRDAGFTPTPETLDQAQRFGQTWARQTREDYMSGCFRLAESFSSKQRTLWRTAGSLPPFSQLQHHMSIVCSQLLSK